MKLVVIPLPEWSIGTVGGTISGQADDACRDVRTTMSIGKPASSYAGFSFVW